MKHSHSSREIEFGLKVKKSKTLLSFLNSRGGKPIISKSVTQIYKKENTPYFFRIRKESIGNKSRLTLCLKEDLLSRGIDKGLKVSNEVETEITQGQQISLVKMLLLLGFVLQSTFEKVRREYRINNLQVTLDRYPANDYLEVEGSSRREVTTIFKQIPFEELKEQ